MTPPPPTPEPSTESTLSSTTSTTLIPIVSQLRSSNLSNGNWWAELGENQVFLLLLRLNPPINWVRVVFLTKSSHCQPPEPPSLTSISSFQQMEPHLILHLRVICLIQSIPFNHPPLSCMEMNLQRRHHILMLSGLKM